MAVHWSAGGSASFGSEEAELSAITDEVDPTAVIAAAAAW